MIILILGIALVTGGVVADLNKNSDYAEMNKSPDVELCSDLDSPQYELCMKDQE